MCALAAPAACRGFTAAQNLGKHDSHFLQLVVPAGDGQAVLDNLHSLKATAKADGMHERVFLLLQTASTKVEQALAKEVAAQKRAAERQKKAEAKADEEAKATATPESGAQPM